MPVQTVWFRASMVLTVACVVSSCGGDREPASTGPATTAKVTTSIPFNSQTTLAASVSSTTVPPTTTTMTATVRASFVDQCADTNVTAAIMAQFGDVDPRLDELGVVLGEDVGETLVRRIEFGQLYHPDEGEWSRYSTVEDDELGRVHAMLHFNQARVLIESFGIMQRPETIRVFDSVDADASELASIGPLAVSYRDEDITPLYAEMTGGAWNTDATALPEPLSEADRTALWEVVAAQEKQYSGAALGNLESILILRDIDLSDVRSSVCRLMGTEAIVMIDAIQSGNATFSTLFPYLALEELLLATEYLELATDLLNEPDVDWLEGPNNDLSVFYDEVTSVGEHIGFLQSGAMGAIFEYRQMAQHR